MTNSKAHIDKLTGALQQLGSTPDDVAAFLAGQGIKGRRLHAFQCPIARYVALLGYRVESVSATSGLMLRNKTWFPIPDAVKAFILQYDMGRYEGYWPRFEDSPITRSASGRREQTRVA